MDILQEVEDTISDGLQLSHRHGRIVLNKVTEGCLNILLDVWTGDIAEYGVKMIESQRY